MSIGRWETINGSRYYNEESEMDASDGGSFTFENKEWDVVKEMSLEEACAYVGKGKDWVKATEEELLVGAFGEGIPGMAIQPSGNIIVDMDSEKTQTPFGFAETAPLLELLWRKTGADCPGEEADLELPKGTYHVILKE